MSADKERLRAVLTAEINRIDAEAEMILAAYQRALKNEQALSSRILRGHWCFLQGQRLGVVNSFELICKL